MTEQFAPKPEPKQKEESDKFRLPQVPERIQDQLEGQIHDARKDFDQMTYYYNRFKETHPIEFANLEQKHPKLFSSMQASIQTLDSLNKADISDSEFVETVKSYNDLAKNINTIIGKIQKEEIQNQVAANVNIPEPDLTPEQKRELKQCAKDLLNEIFPESYVDKVAKFSNSQFGLGEDELFAAQRYLLIPANGVECLITGFVHLLNPNTYSELYNNLSTLTGAKISEDAAAMSEAIKLIYKNLDVTDSIVPVLNIIAGAVFLFGGLSKIEKLVNAGKISSKVSRILHEISWAKFRVNNANIITRAIPLAFIAGYAAPYLYENNSCTNPES